MGRFSAIEPPTSPRSRVALALAASATLAGCQLILGLEDRHEPRNGADAGAVLPPAPIAARGAPPPPSTPSCAEPSLSCAGVCVTVEGDPAHCGECGRSCLGAACVKGECVPEKLADVAYGLIAAVDDEEVFYRPTLYETLSGLLLARNKKTGAERTVVSDLGRWYSAALLGEELVVVENGLKPRVRRIHRKTGVSTTLYEQATASPLFQYVVPDGDTLYFTTRSDVRRINVDGSGYSILRHVDDGPNGAVAIATLGARVFFSVADSSTLYALDKASPFDPPAMIGSGGAPVSTITVVGDVTCWTSGSMVNVLDAGGTTSPLDAGLRNGHSAATRGGMLYVYDVEFGTTTSRILRFDPSTKAIRVLASGLMDGRLAVDDTHVYYANYAGGLYRIPR